MSLKITTFRGVSYPVTYRHVNSSGVLQPLTGKTLYFTVKLLQNDTDASDATAIIKKTITSHVDADGNDTSAAGTSYFVLTDVDMNQTPGKYFFDFIVENANGQALPPSAYGTFEIKGHPTNRNTLNG